jgi:hypothetical protein
LRCEKVSVLLGNGKKKEKLKNFVRKNHEKESRSSRRDGQQSNTTITILPPFLSKFALVVLLLISQLKIDNTRVEVHFSERKGGSSRKLKRIQGKAKD